MNVLAIKIIAVVLLVSGIFTAGYFFGWRSNHDDVVSLTSSLQQAAKDQAAAVKAKEIENDQTTMAVANSYSSELNSLQHTNTSNKPSRVSQTTQHTSTTPSTNGERSGTCEGTVFYNNALKCELQLKWIREWVSTEHIPVK